MSSSNRRERELARQKRERQLARAAGHKRRNQNLLVYLIGVGVLVIGLWAVVGGGTPSAAPSDTVSETPQWCGVAPQPIASPSQYEKFTKTDLSGKYVWTLKTNCGEITIDLFADKAPKTVQSIFFLSKVGFYNNTPCHRISDVGLFMVQCGDPTGTGGGGPGYTVPDENFPAAGANNYPAGTVAMANSGTPNSGGSQFFIVYEDTELAPSYTIVGQVSTGLDIIKKLAAAGNSGDNPAGGGTPNIPFGIRDSSVRSTDKVADK